MSMHRVGKLSKRIESLKQEIMARKGSFIRDGNPFVYDVALWRAVRENRSRVQVRAALLHEVVKIAPVAVRPGWSLAGEHICSGFGLNGEPNAEQVRQLRALGVKEDEVGKVREAVQNWSRWGSRHPAYSGVGDLSAENRQGVGGWGTMAKDTEVVYWAGGWVENHSIRDYPKVLRIGFDGIRRQVEKEMASADIADPGFPGKENFWKAALEICDAGALLGRRYAALARSLAKKEENAAQKRRLEFMARTCARVPAKGARTFFEATQALWLSHILTCGEDGINANSIGRLDQMLFPYYEADVKAGRLTRGEAVEIMEELACKLYLDYDVQAITIGGLDRDGNDATNEVSHIILDATRNVDVIRDLSLRVHRKSPPDFLRHGVELIVRGGGIPFMFNDECFVKALSDRGISLEDARNYSPIGCIELTVPGRANPHAVSGWFNSAKCLELALFDGVNPATGLQLGPRTGKLGKMKSFDELFAAYCAQVEFFAGRMVYICNVGELRQREGGPLPCWSTLTDDCIARGRDITDGGAVYNYHSICFLGTANTADSMMAVKRLVFEDKRVAPGELLDALRANFEGREPLRRMLMKDAPKYGNDCAEVDSVAARVCGHFIDLMDRMRSPLNGRYYVHLFSFLCNIPFGKTVGALPDGRKAGEPVAYSLSAHQGRDQKGVSALINSLSRLPHDRAGGATAAIIEIDPALVKGEDGIRRLTQTIQSAIAMKVGQLQWNVTTVERLKQAQADPEKYGNICVRVAGFSQMFKLVDKELQDHIIARTKHRQG